MERTEDLGLSGLKIIQDDDLYRFTSDAIILSRFARVKKGDVCADFCSGGGIVGLHLYGLHPEIKSVTMFEMQKPLFDLSKKSVKLNGLEDKFTAVNSKVQSLGAEYNEKFSLIVCNPPYMEKGRGEMQEREEIAVCRRELTLTMEELIAAAAKALKFGGRFSMVHRADRLTDAMELMRRYNLEPKRLQFVSGAKKPPYLFLTEGVKGGKRGLKVFETIVN